MTLFEDDTHVFIVRIWRERREIEDAPAQWRGVIEHIPSGQRRYLKDLADVSTFIGPFLVKLGIDLNLSERDESD